MDNQTLLRSFDITEKGFLPSQINKLPKYFDPWENLVRQLDILNEKKETRKYVNSLIPLLDANLLGGLGEYQRAYSILTMIGNSYMWSHGVENFPKILPKQIAIPLCNVSDKLGLKPVLTHATVDLYNWEIIDPSKPFGIDNLRSLNLMTGARDEEWFYLVMVDIEEKASRIYPLMIRIFENLNWNENEECFRIVVECLKDISNIIHEIGLVIKRTRKNCSPEFFYNTLRPYLSGTEKHGLIYKGVSDEPLYYAGGSAAQSSVFPVLDAFFGVNHYDKYFDKIIKYMPQKHQDFVQYTREYLNLKPYIVKNKNSEIEDHFNQCLNKMVIFRKIHMGLVHSYIVNMTKSKDTNGTDGVEPSKDIEGACGTIIIKGTGGTELNGFLKNSIDDTLKVLN